MTWLISQVNAGKEYKGKLDVYDIFDAKYDHTIRSNENLNKQMEQLMSMNNQLVQQLGHLVAVNENLRQQMG